ncbi:alpha/beta hydrolase [Streptomyces canus]|uniref:hypothetical protein n=1 Tax=Streptomyces canus TaxID=58343 RepID=UPI002E2C26BD|nr:hypothetical protein [Streptomyces canus]
MDFTDPTISIANADLTGLPPTTVHYGEYETLADDGAQLGRRLTVACRRGPRTRRRGPARSASHAFEHRPGRHRIGHGRPHPGGVHETPNRARPQRCFGRTSRAVQPGEGDD